MLLKAAASSYYKGALQSGDSTPDDVGATWYPAPLTASSDLKNVMVILHFHGGAFVVGDGRTVSSLYYILRKELSLYKLISNLNF